MDYSAVTGGTGDPSYIAVDTDGYIYLTYLKTGSGKGSHVGKISADGKSLVKEAEVTQAYGICEAGDYVFAATYNKADSCVKVLKKADLSEVATLKYAAQANNLSDVAFGGDTLFVGDHGNNTENGGAYYKADGRSRDRRADDRRSLSAFKPEHVRRCYHSDSRCRVRGACRHRDLEEDQIR